MSIICFPYYNISPIVAENFGDLVSFIFPGA